MESQIDELIEKYWEGNTSLEEEKQIKAYFKENPSLAPQGLYFRDLEQKSKIRSNQKFANPGKKTLKAWMSVAATISIGVFVGLMVLRDAGQRNDFEIEDPQEAYEITKKALMMMSTSLNEGQVYSTELQKLNKAEEILKEQNL